jgi:NitT/TauT family transport system substrate-binding protein
MAAIAAETGGEPLYLLDSGFFAKFGIDVEMNLFTSGGQITNALAGGALDVGIADPIQVGNAFNRGLPFGYFAGGVEYSTDAATTQLCVAKSGPIKSAKDLDGQTIGVYGLGSMPEFAAKEWLRSNGVDVARLKFVEIPRPHSMRRSAVVRLRPGWSASRGSPSRAIANLLRWGKPSIPARSAFM